MVGIPDRTNIGPQFPAPAVGYPGLTQDDGRIWQARTALRRERESERCDTLTCRRLPVNVAWQRTEATTGLERRTCRVGDRTCSEY
ncbi:hypothetical protein BDP55DRAFT_651033 [Colletotrichum godetiae]|uniref:Uncharacterized protein n=1 Tax=Colletotrichum godetiae TaxID=1209918 RepID=A0AAJ0F2I1_9PEZI|nr:uncharacterized protein BDP55DRAFT_651033 [Colletotrichum godetiae]KAK1690523.1 hypothetical protein BDP55DRAFT_651033 [Colletotrichum godetiae]